MKTIKLFLSGLLFLTPFLGNAQEWDDIYANPDKQTTRLIQKQEEPQQPQKKRRMSNKELQARVKRMQLEKQYRDLTNELTPKTKSKMEKLISTADTISKLSSSGLTIYKNLNQFAELSAKKKKG